MKSRKDIQKTLNYIIDLCYSKKLNFTAKEIKKNYKDFGDWVHR